MNHETLISSSFCFGISQSMNELVVLPDTAKTLHVIAEINSKLKEMNTVIGLTDLFSQVPRPIVVDLNRVLANDSYPLEMNPQAPSFLSKLKRMGNIVIVTNAVNWNKVMGFLHDSKLWDDEFILITAPQFREFVGPLDAIDNSEKKLLEL